MSHARSRFDVRPRVRVPAWRLAMAVVLVFFLYNLGLTHLGQKFLFATRAHKSALDLPQARPARHVVEQVSPTLPDLVGAVTVGYLVPEDGRRIPESSWPMWATAVPVRPVRPHRRLAPRSPEGVDS